MIPTPALDKISEFKDELQIIGEFLEWLRGCYEICSLVTYGEDGQELINPYWVPSYKTINNLLAEYYDIDEEAAEAERQALLEEHVRRVYGTV